MPAGPASWPGLRWGPCAGRQAMQWFISDRGAAGCRFACCRPGILAWVMGEGLCRLVCGTAWVGRLMIRFRPVAQRTGLRQGGFPVQHSMLGSTLHHQMQGCSVVLATGAGSVCLGQVGAECRQRGGEEPHLRQGRCKRRPSILP